MVNWTLTNNHAWGHRICPTCESTHRSTSSVSHRSVAVQCWLGTLCLWLLQFANSKIIIKALSKSSKQAIASMAICMKLPEGSSICKCARKVLPLGQQLTVHMWHAFSPWVNSVVNFLIRQHMNFVKRMLLISEFVRYPRSIHMDMEKPLWM
jgi:hypothetical protein